MSADIWEYNNPSWPAERARSEPSAWPDVTGRYSKVTPAAYEPA